MSRVRLQRIMGNEAGFTLIELLAVAIILVVLSLMALPVYAELTDQNRSAVGAQVLTTIEGHLEAYKADHGHYPSRLGLLVERGYIKPNDLESKWSSKSRTVYLFYAVDDPAEGRAMAYAVGDPGPKASSGCAVGAKSATLHQDVTKALPCGRNPWTAWNGADDATQPWSFGTRSNLTILTSTGAVYTVPSAGKGVTLRKTLGGFRPDLKTES